MPCPTCSHTLQQIGVLEGRAWYWCPRCGTLRMTSGSFVHDEAPSLVERHREFIRMIDDTQAGRWLREQCHISGVTEAVNVPGERK